MSESPTPIGRWVVVRGGAIVGGPYLWDGEAEWQPPEPGELVRESDALKAGHTYPQP